VLSFVTALGVEAVFAFLKSEPPNAFLPGIEHFFAFSPTNPNRVSFMEDIASEFSKALFAAMRAAGIFKKSYSVR
jgi:hypothetical protein